VNEKEKPAKTTAKKLFLLSGKLLINAKLTFALAFVFELALAFAFDLAPNGLRYPRWGGRRDAVRLEKCSGVEKGLESRQNPQRRVHALLGAVIALYCVSKIYINYATCLYGKPVGVG